MLAAARALLVHAAPIFIAQVASIGMMVVDTAVLGQCYMKFMLYQQVAAQANTVAAEAPQAEQDQIKKVAAEWSASKTRSVRTMLTARFQNDARVKFEQFVADYTTAEKSSDPQFLASVGQAFGFTDNDPEKALPVILRNLRVVEKHFRQRTNRSQRRA